MKIEITPVVVLPDMSPLIHLAAAGCLWLLHEFGRVVIMDVVAFEASGDGGRPWAREVAAWLADGQKPDSDRPVEIVKTEIGEAYRLARQADPETLVVIATTRALLAFAEERGLIRSAEAAWTDIITRAEGANPQVAATVLRPTREP